MRYYHDVELQGPRADIGVIRPLPGMFVGATELTPNWLWKQLPSKLVY